MNNTHYKLEDVFKQTGFPEYTYVEREEYDAIFKNSLLDGGSLVYLYGDSKSGKTSMWKKHICHNDYIEIKITKKMTITYFYEELMSKVEPFVETNYETAEGTESSVNMNGEGFKAVFKASAGAENKDSTIKTIKYERIANPGLTLTTVTDAVSKIKKIVILEDFQVAADEFVKDIAHVLKAFADNTIKVIIVGIGNRVPTLVREREDISGRLTTINLSHFKKEELKSIILLGEEKLNIRFSDSIVDFLINESFERAYILQGLCRYLCIIQEIEITCDYLHEIHNMDDAKKACIFLASSVQGLYESTARNIAEAATKKNPHDPYRWILTILKYDISIGNEGVPASTIIAKIIEHVPNFPPSSIYPCLNNIPKKQTTAVFRYKDTKLYVDDRLFLFYLKWGEGLTDIFKTLP